MVDLNTLFAQTVLEVIKLKFSSQIGENSHYIISFENKKGYKIYVEKTAHNIKISAYKVSARSYYKEFDGYVNMLIAITELKEKLKL